MTVFVSCFRGLLLLAFVIGCFCWILLFVIVVVGGYGLLLPVAGCRFFLARVVACCCLLLFGCCFCFRSVVVCCLYLIVICCLV